MPKQFHDAEMLKMLNAYGAPETSWVYGSACRPLSATWCRFSQPVIFVQTAAEQYMSYAISPDRLPSEDVEGYELELVSRPTEGETRRGQRIMRNPDMTGRRDYNPLFAEDVTIDKIIEKHGVIHGRALVQGIAYAITLTEGDTWHIKG